MGCGAKCVKVISVALSVFLSLLGVGIVAVTSIAINGKFFVHPSESLVVTPAVLYVIVALSAAIAAVAAGGIVAISRGCTSLLKIYSAALLLAAGAGFAVIAIANPRFSAFASGVARDGHDVAPTSGLSAQAAADVHALLSRAACEQLGQDGHFRAEGKKWKIGFASASAVAGMDQLCKMLSAEAALILEDHMSAELGACVDAYAPMPPVEGETEPAPDADEPAKMTRQEAAEFCAGSRTVVGVFLIALLAAIPLGGVAVLLSLIIMVIGVLTIRQQRKQAESRSLLARGADAVGIYDLEGGHTLTY